MTSKEVRELVVFMLPRDIKTHVIGKYSGAESFDIANNWASAIQQYAGDFSADEVRRILQAAAANFEVRKSFQLPNVINSLRRHRETAGIPEAEFEALAEVATRDSEPSEAGAVQDFGEDISF